MPALHIITGSNGAGKSTVGADYLPLPIRQTCTIFDGDKLFMNKKKSLWQEGITAHKEAKKMALAFVTETFDALVEKALGDSDNFVYEGHFTNEATWDIPRRFQQAGFSIHLIYFGLRDTTLSELRVIDRTKEGGHYVDPVTIASNFYGNLEKLNQHYEMFDTLQIIDSSEVHHQVLAVFTQGRLLTSVEFARLPVWVAHYLPAISNTIRSNLTR